MATSLFTSKVASVVQGATGSSSAKGSLIQGLTGLKGYDDLNLPEFLAHQLGIPASLVNGLLKNKGQTPGQSNLSGPPPAGPPTPQQPAQVIPASVGTGMGSDASSQILSAMERIETKTDERSKLLITTLKRGFHLDEFSQPGAKDDPSKDGGDSILDSLERKLFGKKDRAGRLAKTKLGRLGQSVGRVVRSPVGKIGGGLLAGGIAAASKWWDVKDREDLSGGQKAVQVGATGLGGAGGAIGGMAAGAAVGSVVPIIGTAIGGLIGAGIGGWLGSKGGEMIGEKISDNYKEIVTSVKGGVNKLFGDDQVKEWKEKVGGLWDNITGFFSGLGDKLKGVVSKAGDVLQGAAKKVSDVAVKTYEGGKQLAKDAGAKAVEVASNVKDWVLGSTSKQFESGKGGAGTISSGKGDLGGKSYGTYQMTGDALKRFTQQGKYSESFRGMDMKSAEFDAKWKELSKDPEFGKQQHEFIKGSHFDPQHKTLQKAGIDLSKRGAAVQDAIWSTSVQFGGGSGLIKDALKGQDVGKLSDAEIVSAIQDYKKNNNDKLFKSSSSDVRAGTANRAEAEKKRLLALVKAEQDQPQVAKAEKPEEKKEAYPERSAVREASAGGGGAPSQVGLRDLPLSPMDGQLTGVNTGKYNA